MHIEIRAILDFFKDSIERIVIILGAFLFLISVLLLSPVYQWFSSLSLFFGVTLIIIGTALHFESFKWKVPSAKGLGAILIYVSLLFMAAAVATAILAVPKRIALLPVSGGRDEHDTPRVSITPGAFPHKEGSILVMFTEHPYTCLAALLMLTGLGLLALGCLLKFAKDIF